MNRTPEVPPTNPPVPSAGARRAAAEQTRGRRSHSTVASRRPSAAHGALDAPSEPPVRVDRQPDIDLRERSTGLSCPACGSDDLHIATAGGGRVHQCDRCERSWLMLDDGTMTLVSTT
jgi:hypothetical protein